MSDIFALLDKISKDRKPQLPISHIVVGLGNPEPKYANNRHNAGFMFIDYCSSKYGCKVDRAKFSALVGECDIGGKRVLMMKPTTYMNHSGVAVRAAADFYKIPTENIIVISDDTSFDVGKLRIKRKGSDGGQRGLRSIITELSSDNFPRIKLGVGKKPRPDYDMADWVLSDIPKEQRPDFADAVARGALALELMLAGDFDLAMNKYN